MRMRDLYEMPKARPPGIEKFLQRMKAWGFWINTEGGPGSDCDEDEDQLRHISFKILREKMADLGFIEAGDDPFGQLFVSRSDWKIVKKRTEGALSIYVGHYDEEYIEPISGPAENVAQTVHEKFDPEEAHQQYDYVGPERDDLRWDDRGRPVVDDLSALPPPFWMNWGEIEAPGIGTALTGKDACDVLMILAAFEDEED